jgi:hypothetical protein
MSLSSEFPTETLYVFLWVPTAVIYCSGPSAIRTPGGPDNLGPIIAHYFPMVIIIIIIIII